MAERQVQRAAEIVGVVADGEGFAIEGNAGLLIQLALKQLLLLNAGVAFNALVESQVGVFIGGLQRSAGEQHEQGGKHKKIVAEHRNSCVAGRVARPERAGPKPPLQR